MEQQRTQGRFPVEIRVLLVLAVAFGLWLWVVPTASVDGTNCGVPLGTSTESDGRAPDCVGRNQVRMQQGFLTLVGAGIVAAAVSWMTRMRDVRSRAPKHDPEADGPHNWYDESWYPARGREG